MGTLSLAYNVCAKILKIKRIDLASEGLSLEWEGEDLQVCFNCRQTPTGKTSSRQDGVLYAETGYGYCQYYLDVGLYSESMLHELYQTSSPPYSEHVSLGSKYTQPTQEIVIDRPRCLLSQLTSDLSTKFTKGAYSPNYKRTIQQFLEKYGSETIIKNHPKLPEANWWKRISERYNVPLLDFPTAQLSSFQQVLAWSSTALLEGITTDMVQLGRSSLGTFVGARTPNSLEEVGEICPPTPLELQERLLRTNWLFSTFCRARPQKSIRLSRLETRDDRLELFKQHIRDVQKGFAS